MLGTRCETGFVQPLRGTKEAKCAPCFQVRNASKHIQGGLKNTVQKPHHSADPRGDLTGWTVLKHIYACVLSYSAAPQCFLLECYRQPLRMHGDTALPGQSSCGMHITICEPIFSLETDIRDPVLLALVQFLFLP